MLVNEDGTRNLLYTDQDQTARGYFELFDGPFLARPDDVEILGSNFTPKTVQITPETIKYFSSAYPGDANSGYVDGVHTAVLYTDEWLGEFTIQASLENEIPTDENDWFEVTTQTFTTPVSGLTTYTFTGNYMWVRFRYYNDINNTGSVEKVLYKN